MGGPEQLPQVGGEAVRAFEATVRGPRMRAALSEVLAAHHDIAGARMGRDEMIEILARIGFVAHQEVWIGEAEILDEQRVARQLSFAPVLDREPPQPDVRVRVERQRDAKCDAALLSRPDEAVVRDADAGRRLGAGARQDRGVRAADSNNKAPHPAGDWRTERLIDDDPAGDFGVFERKDRAVRQQADR